MPGKTALLAALLVSISICAVACTGSKHKAQPQIIRSSPASSAAASVGGKPSAVQILSASAGIGAVSGGNVSPILPQSTTASSLSSRGLTVRDTEGGNLPADDVYVVVLSPIIPPIPGGLSGTSSRNQADILKALDAIGIKKDDVSFDAGGSGGPFSNISVHTTLAGLPDQGKKIIDAVETVTGRSQSSGARFALTNCKTAIEPVRKKAFEVASAEAKDVASMASVTLGPLVSASETISPTAPNAPTSSDPCNPLGPGFYPGIGNLQPLDAKAEVTARIEVVLTYAIGNDTAAGGLLVSGSGNATAKADEAYIVAQVSTLSGPTGPQPISTKARADLIAKLKALKIDEADIQIGSPPYGGQTVISVEADLKNLPAMGKSIVGAIEDALNTRVDTQGVRFDHSNCQAVLLEARKQALLDAKRSADSLAGVAGVKLGALSTIEEPSAASLLYPGSQSSGCNDDFTQAVLKGSYATGLKPFDAEPVFTVSTALNLTYSIAP